MASAFEAGWSHLTGDDGRFEVLLDGIPGLDPEIRFEADGYSTGHRTLDDESLLALRTRGRLDDLAIVLVPGEDPEPE